MLFEENDCKLGIHVFPTSKSRISPRYPNCIQCGEVVVDWDRVRRRSPEDIDFVISELKKEKERYLVWTAEVDIKARNHAMRKGLHEFRNYTVKRLTQLIGRVFDLGDYIKRPYRDGYQTPYSGNLVYYGQHATACCCRPCVARWHGIPQGRDLAEDELEYLSELVIRYVEFKVPEIQENGLFIPPIRRKT